MSKTKILLVMNFFNLIGVFYYVNYFIENEFLPYPFVYDKNDTFMDFFNPLWWTINGGFYSVWNSVYPPLNFFFLKLLSLVIVNNDFSNPFELRDYYFNAIYIYIFFYFLFPLTFIFTKVGKSFRGANKFLIYFLSLSLAPSLFMLERGNLIILPLILIPILLLTKNNYFKAFIIALLINLKPYFVIYLFYFIAKRRFKYLFYSIFLSLLFFILFGLIVGDTYYALFNNLLSFANLSPITSPRELISFPSNISVWLNVMRTEQAIISGTNVFGDFFVVLNILANLAYYFNHLLVIIALGYIIKFGIHDREEIIFFLLTLVITHLGSNVGGYSLVFYIAFIPLFFKLGRVNISFLIFFVLIMFNYDYINLLIRSGDAQYSFLAYSYKTISHWELGISAILRPMANALLFILFLRHLFKSRNRLKEKIIKNF